METLTKQKNSTAALLDRMYKNVKMGADSIINLMPKVQREELRTEMTTELSKLEEYSTQINKMIAEEGVEAKEENVVSRMSAKMGMAMNTMMDSTTNHIAEMMMEGYTMGIADMTKDIREYENTTASEASLKLAREVVNYYERCYDRMKKFL